VYIGLLVKYPLFLSGFNETLIFLTGFQKKSHIKFHENSSQWDLIFSMWTDMTKLLEILRMRLKTLSQGSRSLRRNLILDLRDDQW
jgi:hypothetical protein